MPSIQLTDIPQFLNIYFVTGLLIFRAVAEPRISSKSTKSREIHKNTRNLLEKIGLTTEYRATFLKMHHSSGSAARQSRWLMSRQATKLYTFLVL